MKEIEKFNEIIDIINSGIEIDKDDKEKQQLMVELLYLILRDKSFARFIHRKVK